MFVRVQQSDKQYVLVMLLFGGQTPETAKNAISGVAACSPDANP